MELTTQLILAEYLVRLANHMIATTTALVVGKAVLVADALPFMRRHDAGPMTRPILFKSVVYWAVVFLARILELVIEYWIHSGTFLLYNFLNELDAWLGESALFRMLFGLTATLADATRRRPA